MVFQNQTIIGSQKGGTKIRQKEPRKGASMYHGQCIQVRSIAFANPREVVHFGMRGAVMSVLLGFPNRMTTITLAGRRVYRALRDGHLEHLLQPFHAFPVSQFLTVKPAAVLTHLTEFVAGKALQLHHRSGKGIRILGLEADSGRGALTRSDASPRPHRVSGDRHTGRPGFSTGW